MTVKEYAEKHRKTMLSMMTPCGFLDISAHDLLGTDKVRTNPGCSGCDMVIEAATILKMKIVHIHADETTVSMLVE